MRLAHRRAFLAVALIGLLLPVARAAEVTVYRDRYGVPSIEARSVVDAMYALGYEQAKAQPERMATNYKIARGRLSEIQGKGQLLVDTFVRGLGFEDRAQEKAASLSGESAEVVDAFLAGANRAVAEGKGQLPAWIGPFDRTDVLSLLQFVNSAFPLLELSQKISPGAGSNQFAIAPSRSATHHPILSIDPHLDIEGGDFITWFEFGMYTGDIRFRGISIPGLPAGALGHNDRVAWSMTNNDPSLTTRYRVVVNPENKNQYSYHGVWKDFIDTKAEFRYLEDGVLKSRTQTIRRTAWGPMVPFRAESVQMPTVGNFAGLDQGLRMMRAKNVHDFRDALALHGLSMWNFVFADVDGNIAYQYNAMLPEREPGYPWREVVPGDDPKTALGQLLGLDRLPYVENPSGGLLVNANSAPWLTPLGSSGISADWPSYITSYMDTTRRQLLAEKLQADRSITPVEAMTCATDTEVPYARRTVAQLGDAQLSKWSGRADRDARGCALYLYWLRERPENPPLAAKAGRGEIWSADERTAARESLNRAKDALRKDHGSLDVPWGDVLVLRRGPLEVGASGFGYMTPGGVAAVMPTGPRGQKDALKDGKVHARFGSSFRMVVSLVPGKVRSWSVLPYGNSWDPKSPHYADQLPLYAVGRYKETSFGIAEAKRTAMERVVLTR